MYKNKKKLLIATLLLVFSVNILSLFFIFISPASADTIEFTPQVTVGDFEKGDAKIVSGNTGMIGAYIKQIFEYAIGIVGIVAASIIAWGGISYLTAGGSADKISNAKSWISAALFGLILAMASYLLLSIVNPNLVNFKISEIKNVNPATNNSNINSTNSTTTVIGGSCTSNTNCSTACLSGGFASGACNNNICECTSPTVATGSCTSDIQCEAILSCTSSQSAICNLTTSDCYCDNNECTNKSDGYSCSNGYCYSEVCLTGDGGNNEVCGNEGGVCMTGSLFCPSGFSTDYGGRDCISGYLCCN